MGFLTVLVISLISSIAAQAQSFELTGMGLGDLLRNANGRVLHRNQSDAESDCVEEGRLPTARELANYAHSQGACVILSPSEYESFRGTRNCPKSGYYQIRVAASATEPADDFYYSRNGYQPPAGDLGTFTLWSTSVDPDHSSAAHVLNARSGEFYLYYRRSRYTDSAVRCMR